MYFSNFKLFFKKLLTSKIIILLKSNQTLVIQFLVNLTSSLPIIVSNITNINLISSTLFVLSKMSINDQSAVIIYLFTYSFASYNKI
jgi:hypothetical protein